MHRDPNNGDDYEAHYFPDPVKQRDVDRDIDDAQLQREIEEEMAAERRAFCERSVAPTLTTEAWAKITTKNPNKHIKQEQENAA